MILVESNKKIRYATIGKTIERDPVKLLGQNYKLKINYKNVKVAQLNIEDSVISIVLQNKYKKIDNKQMLDFAIQKMYEEVAKVEIERAMEKARIMLGFAPEDYSITKIKNKLGKCIENFIIINPDIVKYDRSIIDYIVIHEYCHLKYKTHSKGFEKMLKKYVPNYYKFNEKLIGYTM